MGCLVTVFAEYPGAREPYHRPRVQVEDKLFNLKLQVFSYNELTTFECFPNMQPFILRNSVKTTLFLLQQDHPLYASWNTGKPGWC